MIDLTYIDLLSAGVCQRDSSGKLFLDKTKLGIACFETIPLDTIAGINAQHFPLCEQVGKSSDGSHVPKIRKQFAHPWAMSHCC